MRAYRVEHKSTQAYSTVISTIHKNPSTDPRDFWGGPYKNLELVRKHDSSPDHPGPIESGIIKNPKHIFGFTTLKALRKWFDSVDRDLLHSKGYHIVVLDLSHRPQICKRGSGQILFNPRKSKKIGYRRLYD